MASQRRRDPLLERALLDASLKVDPQVGALRSLLSDQAGTYSRTRRVNASNAAGIEQATADAQPKVASAFDQALASAGAQRAALGVGGSDPQAEAYTRRVGEQKATALADLVRQGVSAASGKVYANQAARDDYFGAKDKIEGQIQGLVQTKGSEAASAYGKLRDAQLQRGVTKRGQTLSSKDRAASLAERVSHDKVLEQQGATRLAQQGSGGPKLATTAAHAAARDGIGQAAALVKQQRDRGATSRAEIIQLLSTGRAASKVKVNGQDVSIPAIPKLPADFVRAATNLVFDGTLSGGDVKRLHDRRLRVRSLGLPTRKKPQHSAQVQVGKQSANFSVPTG